MKAIVLILGIFVAVSAESQSLRDALYSGRLKNDSGTVIKKEDDIKSRIDTSMKKTLEILARDSAAKAVVRADSVKKEKIKENIVSASKEIAKGNNSLWKEFIEQLSTDVKSEVLPSKKIKEGTYSVLIDYQIEINGVVTVNNVSAAPANSFLENQLKERIIQNAPKLTPAVMSNGKPRVAIKKQLLSFTK